MPFFKWTCALFILHVVFAVFSYPFGAGSKPRDLIDIFDDSVFDSPENTRVDSLGSEATSLSFGEIIETPVFKTQALATPTSTSKEHSITGGPSSIYPTATPSTTHSLTPTPTTTAITNSIKISQASSMPPAEAAQWKVIGLVVICITFVGTLILSVVFFDSWWGFLRAMVCGRKRDGGAEDLVPDWDKRSWEVKLANEDGHRYPTIGSLEQVTAAKMDSPYVASHSRVPWS